MNGPIKFLPFFKSTIWGGEQISRFKGMNSNCANIGESWELSGIDGCESIVATGEDAGMTLSALSQKYKEKLLGGNVVGKFGTKFPLLIKFIDARQDLSLQVHPDDALAKVRHNSLGKTEMWYILDTTEGAKIRTGLTHAITPEEYTDRVAKGNLIDVVGCYDSEPGDVYFLPAGRLHAIGAGNLLIEIQESSDITYRVDDYGRRDANGNLRELHTEQARDAIDYSYYPDCKSHATALSPTTKQLVRCSYFDVRTEDVDGLRSIANTEDSFMSISCLKGECEVTDGKNTMPMKQGDTILMPAEVASFNVNGKAELLTVTVPKE